MQQPRACVMPTALITSAAPPDCARGVASAGEGTGGSGSGCCRMPGKARIAAKKWVLTGRPRADTIPIMRFGQTLVLGGVIADGLLLDLLLLAAHVGPSAD